MTNMDTDEVQEKLRSLCRMGESVLQVFERNHSFVREPSVAQQSEHRDAPVQTESNTMRQ